MKEEPFSQYFRHRHRPSTEQSCWPQDKLGESGGVDGGAAIIEMLSQWSNLSLSCEAGRDVCDSVRMMGMFVPES